MISRQLDYFLVSYLPNPLSEKRFNIGLLALGRIGEVLFFSAARMYEDVAQLVDLDPNADMEMLRAFAQEVEAQFQNPRTAEVFLRMMLDRVSNTLQVSDGCRIPLTGDPNLEVDRLSFNYLHRPLQTSLRKTI